MKENFNKLISNYGSDKNIVRGVIEELKKIKESGYFEGTNKVNIYYEKYVINNEKGRVVISHGFCECLDKYKELIYYFTEMGYSVYAVEHRGHGRSGSLSNTDKTQINIDKFNYYVEDLKIFIDKFVFEEGSNLYLYAHSMGGAIGTMFLEKYNQYFKKAILNAPMMEIDTGKYPKVLSHLISKIYMIIGKGEKYVFGHGPFDGKYNLEESGTTNHYRYQNHLDELIEDNTIQRSGASFNWINEALKATKEILKEDNIDKINIPLLLFQAGRDTFVKEKGHNKFCESAKNCKKIRFENGKHELYIENDEILLKYFKIIEDFLK